MRQLEGVFNSSLYIKKHCRGVLKGFPKNILFILFFQITGKFTLSKVCRLPFLLILSHPLLIWFRILDTHPFTLPDPAQWPSGDEKIKFFLFFSFILSIFHEYPFVNSFLLSYRTRYHVIAISSFTFSSYHTAVKLECRRPHCSYSFLCRMSIVYAMYAVFYVHSIWISVRWCVGLAVGCFSVWRFQRCDLQFVG